MIRITGGKFKQKKLASINDFVRPTSSIKREAFFSIIESYAIKNSIELYKNIGFQEIIGIPPSYKICNIQLEMLLYK